MTTTFTDSADTQPAALVTAPAIPADARRADTHTAVRLAVTFVCVLALAGCAAQDPTSASGGGTRGSRTPSGASSSQSTAPQHSATPTETTDSAPGGPGSVQATSVTVRVTGGIGGIDERRSYAEGEPPPPGRTEADVEAALDAASNPELMAVEMAKLPPDACCDRQSYTVTVTYDDGSHRTYTSIDGVEQPPVFETFLGML